MVNIWFSKKYLSRRYFWNANIAVLQIINTIMDTYFLVSGGLLRAEDSEISVPLINRNLLSSMYFLTYWAAFIVAMIATIR